LKTGKYPCVVEVTTTNQSRSIQPAISVQNFHITSPALATLNTIEEIRRNQRCPKSSGSALFTAYPMV
jgi:hypothetical protein